MRKKQKRPVRGTAESMRFSVAAHRAFPSRAPPVFRRRACMGSAFFNLEDRPQNTGQALRAFAYHNLHLGTSLSPALGRGCGRTRTPLHYYIQNRGKMLPARRLLSREHQIDHARGKPERCRFGGELVAHADGERMCERIIVQRIFQPLQRNTRRLLPGAPGCGVCPAKGRSPHCPYPPASHTLRFLPKTPAFAGWPAYGPAARLPNRPR